MNRIVTFAVFATLLAPAASAEQLWTQKQDSAHAVAIPSLGPLVKDVEGAVLTVTTEARGGHDERSEMLRRFGMSIPNMPRKGQGTGFIIHPSGYALTNNHVVEGADTITVRVGGGSKEYTAKVIGTDPRTDVALIRIQGKERFPVIPLGDSDKLQVGDFVVAMGNPFGLSQSVSLGIISARGRRDINPGGKNGLYDFLQTDASINPGNSGGPLMNMRGEVIGINTAINAAGQGLGFAIPINLVKRLVAELKSSGHVSRSWIGVGIRKVSADLADSFGLDRPRGALVTTVVPDGPADKAGLEPGDVITRFDSKLVEDANQLPLLAGFAGVGRVVNIEIMRDSKARKVRLKLGKLPSEERVAAAAKASDNQLGVGVRDLDRDVRKELRLSRKVRGAYIADVKAGSVGARGDLRKGDVVVQVNGHRITNAKQFLAAVKRTRSGQVLKILLLRGKARVFTALRKP